MEIDKKVGDTVCPRCGQMRLMWPVGQDVSSWNDIGVLWVHGDGRGPETCSNNGGK